MLKIMHRGIQANLDLDTTGFTGDLAVDSALPSITSLVSGRLVSLNAAGKAKLADGASTNSVIGFLVNDASGYFYENKPALASNNVAVTFGSCVVTTDQIVVSETFVPGDKLYAGTAANVGLVTKTAPAADAQVIGVAGSPASAAAPELKIFVVSN